MVSIRVRALATFSEYTPSGIIVFNGPKVGRDGKAIPGTEGELSEKSAVERRDAGMVEWLDEPSVAAGDGAIFTMTHQGFGKFLIEGPGVAPDTVVKGKADAETMIRELEKAHAEASAVQPDEVAAGDGAPID